MFLEYNVIFEENGLTLAPGGRAGQPSQAPPRPLARTPVNPYRARQILRICQKAVSPVLSWDSRYGIFKNFWVDFFEKIRRRGHFILRCLYPFYEFFNKVRIPAVFRKERPGLVYGPNLKSGHTFFSLASVRPFFFQKKLHFNVPRVKS